MSKAAEDTPSDFAFDTESAAKLPRQIRFGTSTWTYPGWRGVIYKRPYRNEKEFKAHCLEEYAEIPWLSSVGIDNTFYTPPSAKQLESYAEALPERFQWVSKVWERITIPRYPKHARYGKHAGTTNADFLNADLFSNEVLERYSAPPIQKRTGPFVFQFQTMGKTLLGQLHFLDTLHSFLKKLPVQFRYAVEIRDPALLGAEYFQVLNECGATHCFNHWHLMPPLHDQMKAAAQAGGLQAPFYVSRILTPLGVKYEEAVKMFEPYRSVQRPNPEMRKDVLRLAKRAIEKDSDAFIIVNNRSEGNAPMTIDALGRLITSEL
ncbi:MAG: DUF72 domain-containing protein [Deltaproteobacteria bacterium]|nr:DUF72 domain-containing protein [Deltaproteobacteria bacterium]